MSRLEGKSIVVTGGGRGLGRAFAERVAREGARVVIAEVDGDQGEATAQALQGMGVEAYAVQTDISDSRSVENLASFLREKWGGIDSLVNNAAIAQGVGGRRFDAIDEAAFQRILEVNVKGTWLVTKAMVPLMRTRDKGKIVNVASDTAISGAVTMLHYVASKGAIIAMTRSLAAELGEYNITVNSIAPGLTLTEATSLIPAERHQAQVDVRAIKRQQVPEDITGAVVFLLSDDADFITGQLLTVNGGATFH